jgi:prophage antirepressor-like protein
MYIIYNLKMLEEIKTDNNCIVKAFENNPISILEEDLDNKRVYYFKASDIGKALNLSNIRVSIQNYDEDEQVVRKAYDLRGCEQDTIFLTSRGVYRLLYNSKKEVAKKFRKWASDILDDIIFNQSNELQRQLKERENKLQLLEIQNKEKQDKINLLTRKTNKFELGESVYIFHSTFTEENPSDRSSDIVGKGTFENIDLYKVGRTKNANTRDSIHKTASYKGILLQVRCVDCVLLERVVHFLLNKYRCANRREWFNCSYDIVKNSIYYAKSLLENEIDLSNPHLLDNTNDFVKNISVPLVDKGQAIQDELISKEQNIFTTLEYKPHNIDNFEYFLNEYFEVDPDSSVSYISVKNQYKIWSKTAKHLQLKKLISYLKTKYTTTSKRYNPLVSSSKLTPHFNGLKLKRSVFEFVKPDNENFVIEQFLYEKCQKAPGYRVTMQDLFVEFEKWYSNVSFNQLTYLVKEKLKNYLDITFIRLRTGDESECVDNRIGGWLGFSLKNNNTPEPIKKYKPKNAKVIIQRDVTTNTILKYWSSVSELSDYIAKSRTVTSTIIKRHEQIIIDNVKCILEYQ